MKKALKSVRKAFTSTKKDVHDKSDKSNIGENQTSQAINLSKPEHASYRAETPPPKNGAEQLAMLIHQGTVTIFSEEKSSNSLENTSNQINENSSSTISETKSIKQEEYIYSTKKDREKLLEPLTNFANKPGRHQKQLSEGIDSSEAQSTSGSTSKPDSSQQETDKTPITQSIKNLSENYSDESQLEEKKSSLGLEIMINESTSPEVNPTKRPKSVRWDTHLEQVKFIDPESSFYSDSEQSSSDNDSEEDSHADRRPIEIEPNTNRHEKRVIYNNTIKQCTISDDANYGDHIILKEDVTITSNPRFGNQTVIKDRVTIHGNPSFGDQTIIKEGVTITGDPRFGNQTIIKEGVTITGNPRFGNHTVIKEDVTITGDPLFGNHTVINKGVIITGNPLFGNGTIRK